MYYYAFVVLVTGPFFLLLLLNQRNYPRFGLRIADCSTFRIICDVPSIAVACSECIECFPGIAFKYYSSLLLAFHKRLASAFHLPEFSYLR
jgi:hypothetical protein